MEILEAIVGNINPTARTNYVGHYVVITFNEDHVPYSDIYYQMLSLKNRLADIGISTRNTGYSNSLYFDLY